MSDVSMALAAGLALDGRYVIERLLGRGGMGEVYAARRKRLDDVVALKRLLPNQDTPNNRQRFAIEAQAAAHIRHPNVVRIFDYGVDAAVGPYLVMELLEGPTLAAIGDAGRLPIDRALAVFTGVCAAIEAGHFNAEILPFQLDDHYPDLATRGRKDDTRLVSTDEGPRKDTTAEALGKLRAVFKQGGSVTAGNSSQMSDGAGAVLLASEQAIKDYGLTPLARFVSFSVAGVRPEVMGIGPIAAIPKALKQAGLTKDQLDWIELNEAFAAQALAVIKDSGLDPSKVNPLGGAIALGHPLGATGAVRTATIVHGLRRRQQKYGMVTMCIGTGMGAAGIFEAL